MTTFIQGTPALVGYTTNMAKGNATTSIVSVDVGKCLLFLYDVTEGNINNVNKKKRGTEFKADTPAAADIKGLLPSAAATYVVYFEPQAFPVGPGHPLLRGPVTDFTLTQTEQFSSDGREYLEAMTAKGKGYIPWNKQFQEALLTNKANLGGILPTVPAGTEFATSNELSFIAPPGDVETEFNHMAALNNLDTLRESIWNARQQGTPAKAGDVTVVTKG